MEPFFVNNCNICEYTNYIIYTEICMFELIVCVWCGWMCEWLCVWVCFDMQGSMPQTGEDNVKLNA